VGGGCLIRWCAGLALVVALLGAVAWAGTSDTVFASHRCADTGSPFGPFPFRSYEDGDYKTTYAREFELAGFNQLFPEYPSFALPPLEVGARDAGSAQTVPPYVPPVLLKAISWMESSWAQAADTVPYGSAGDTLISHDCGYGLMQVTTGMQNISGVPNLDQAMIGGHHAFNIARGAKILAEKWNLAPEFRPIVGSRDPTILENWYYALWGYNGFAFQNHPLNPGYSQTRAPFSCAPDGDGYGHDRSQYPYQEIILGCASRPPIKSGTQLWSPQPVTLPDLGDPAFAGPLSTDKWNPCSYSLECAPLDIPTPAVINKDPTIPTGTRADVLGSPVLTASATSLDISNLPPSPGQSSFTITNTGTGVLAWRATSSASWLKLSALQGVALGSDLGSIPSTVGVQVDSGGLSSAGVPGLLWGDADCDGDVSTRDNQVLLRSVLQQPPLPQTEPCPDVGAAVTASGAPHTWGDWDCDSAVTTRDNQTLLFVVLGQSPLSQTEPCPDLAPPRQIAEVTIVSLWSAGAPTRITVSYAVYPDGSVALAAGEPTQDGDPTQAP